MAQSISPLKNNDGLDPIIIKTAVVGAKNHNYETSNDKINESSYQSDNSYYFVTEGKTENTAVSKKHTRYVESPRGKTVYCIEFFERPPE